MLLTSPLLLTRMKVLLSAVQNSPLVNLLNMKKEPMKVGILGQAETVRRYKCHKCTMVFDEPDDLLQHLLSSHQKTPKRLRQETSTNEAVIINNGKYECHFCHKSYDERHRYNGHLGNHIKDYFKRIQASGETVGIKRSSMPPSVAVHPSALKIKNQISCAVPNCEMKENDTKESYCGKQGLVCSMIDDKSGDSNDIVVVETKSVQEGSPKCSFPAVGTKQMCAPYNNENQLDENLIEGHAQELGSDNNLVAASSIENSENINDRRLSSAINSVENHDRDFCGDNARTVLGNNCSSQEDVVANGKEQRNIPSANDQRYASVNDVHGLSASTTMTYERGSQVGLSSPFDEKIGMSNDKVSQDSTTTMKESRYDDMGGSSKNVLTVGFGSNNVTVEDFVTDIELDSSRSRLVIPTWIDQTSYTENEMNGTHRCTIKKHGQERKSEGEQLTLFGSEQYLGCENTIAKVSNDTTKVPNHDEVLHFQNRMHMKGVNLIAAQVTAAELESSSGNSLLVPSGNELTFSMKENRVLNGAPKNLVQDLNSDSSSHKPSCDDQIFNYENNVNMVSSVTVDQPKIKKLKAFLKGNASCF
ncbi:uncharacterized protein [Euphorbia lathyris]|uniref:uncharacterized protein n=1 Tax=Euphorbia lathyris TaxID=212925 RepID=UPI0033133D0C